MVKKKSPILSSDMGTTLYDESNYTVSLLGKLLSIILLFIGIIVAFTLLITGYRELYDKHSGKTIGTVIKVYESECFKSVSSFDSRLDGSLVYDYDCFVDIEYTIGGKKYIKQNFEIISQNSVKKDMIIHVLYDPHNPYDVVHESSPKVKGYVYLISGIFVILLISIIVFLIVKFTSTKLLKGILNVN